MDRTTVLKLDNDFKAPREWIEKFIETRRRLLEEILGYRVKKILWCYSNKGLHFWIWVEGELKPDEIVLLQWLLGDDPVRCRINYYRLLDGLIPRFNILFSEVKYYRPPDDRCLKCKLYRFFRELSGESMPKYLTRILIPYSKENYSKALNTCLDIAEVDESFKYRIDVENKRIVISVYSGSKEQAKARGSWFKRKVFPKAIYRVYEIAEGDIRPEDR